MSPKQAIMSISLMAETDCRYVAVTAMRLAAVMRTMVCLQSDRSEEKGYGRVQRVRDDQDARLAMV